MSTKSYTLADGTTATVTATEQGIPFNEGMNVLTKAIKAKIEASSNNSSGGAVTTNKLEPALTLTLQNDGNFTWTYNGDGIVFVTGLGDTTFNGLGDSRTVDGYESNPLYYDNAVVQRSSGSGSTVEVLWGWGASGASRGRLVLLHATEGETYASKTVWAEIANVPDYTGVIQHFSNSGTL